MAAGLRSRIIGDEPARLCYPKVMAEGLQGRLPAARRMDSCVRDTWKHGSAKFDRVGGFGKEEDGEVRSVGTALASPARAPMTETSGPTAQGYDPPASVPARPTRR